MFLLIYNYWNMLPENLAYEIYLEIIKEDVSIWVKKQYIAKQKYNSIKILNNFNKESVGYW